MTRASRWLRGLALLHLAVGLVLYREPLLGWVQAGVVNAVEPHWDRMAAFWFLLYGALLYGQGQLAAAFEARREPLPRAFVQGWLLTGLLGTVAMPLSGLPLVALAAALSLRARPAPVTP
ncbi:DUF6463 family protein [Deinococcus multiflagellatus]|uniref:DUF6463 family protein n=1 Tax=Deinococcus multiflagellatus TaxID=1656887 RepID=A0ABW1ZIT1_9DEIO|nr:DUF6463 family protein [Deinococcus multiflagellatus]MBZ9712629.1 DUF6463 family protein [Deinococcus multiflagellatus]